MHYNIVTIRNRWQSYGLLDGQYTVQQEVELARYLQTAMDTIMEMMHEDDLDDKASNIIIISLVELYERLTIKKDNHKINIKVLIEKGMTVFEKKYIEKNDYFKQDRLDTTLRDEIVLDYMSEYGTKG